MQIKISSLYVDDQDRALDFYTGRLGFTKVADIAMGPHYRWLTVASPDGVAGVELALQPLHLPAARDYQRALYAAGVPAMAFVTTDIQAEAVRLREQGVVLRGEPVDMGPIVALTFEDGCGNLLHLVQPKTPE